MGTLFAAFFLPAFSSAEEGCVECDKKSAEVVEVPSMPLNGSRKLTPQDATQDGSTFNDYLGAYCMKYTLVERNELNQVIRDINALPYAVDDFFTIAGCKPEKVGGGVLTPMLQLTAEAPCSRVEYPEIIYHYFTVKRKSPSTWLKIVNAKNTAGDTYLDYVERLNLKGEFSTLPSQECRDELIALACKTGGIYSTAKNKTCPAG
jgi:hypothetical protein